jgi:hypothetical protein
LSKRLRNPEVAGWVMLAGAILIAAAYVFWLERGITYGYDEFVWLEIGGLSKIGQFWHPYGGHLIIVPYYVFRGVLELFGSSFTAFSVVQVICLSLTAALLYIYGRRRVGPILALGPAIVLLFLAGSYPVLLEPMIGIQFLAALLPGLGAIVVLEREDLRGDIAACVLLLLSLGGFSEALPFLLGAIVMVGLSPNWKRRIWVLAIPIVAYGYWRLWSSQFESSGVITSNLPLLPAYFADAIAVFALGVFGMVNFIGPGPFSRWRIGAFNFNFLSEGVVLVIFELLVIGVAVAMLRRRGPIRRSIWPPLAMLFALFVELGVILEPGRTAAEPRYLYAGVLLGFLVVLELARGVKTTRTTVAVTALLTAASLAGNFARGHDAHQTLAAYSQHARADMAVIELAGKKGDQRYTVNQALPNVVSGALVFSTGPWLEVVDRYGSVAYSIPELQAAPDDVRVEADRVAARSLKLHLAPVAALPSQGCKQLSAAEAAAGVDLAPGGAVLRPQGETHVYVRRWGDRFADDLGPLSAGQAARLSIATDSSTVPWALAVSPGTPLELCPQGN